MTGLITTADLLADLDRARTDRAALYAALGDMGSPDVRAHLCERVAATYRDEIAAWTRVSFASDVRMDAVGRLLVRAAATAEREARESVQHWTEQAAGERAGQVLAMSA